MEIPQGIREQPGPPVTVHTATREISVHHVARLMKMRGATSVVVVEAMKPVGIVTDRDIVLRVTASGLDAMRVTVGTIMTSPVLTMTAGDRVDDALALIDRRAIRHLPIVDQAGRLVTLLSPADLLQFKRAGAVTFTGLLPEPVFPPQVRAPDPIAAHVTKFSDIGAPGVSPVPVPLSAPPVAIRPVIVVPMVKRRQWKRGYFAVRAWYHRNRKWMVLMLVVAAVGAVVALVVGSFYDYKLQYYEPKDMSRGEMIEKQKESPPPR